MKVDYSNLRCVLEEYDHLTEELIRLASYIPWDTPDNVTRVRDIYYNRLIKKMRKLTESEEGKEYKLYIHNNLY